MDNERESQHNRLTNNKKSASAKRAWKRHHGSFMRGARERERKSMNKTFYGLAKELETKLTEASFAQDNVFETELEIVFSSLAGGIGMKVNADTGAVSFSTTMAELGSGGYKLTQSPTSESIQALYTNVKDDLFNLCQYFDKEMEQILAKNGLKSTK